MGSFDSLICFFCVATLVVIMIFDSFCIVFILVVMVILIVILFLRYESSTLILYNELSSPIFQSCLSVRHR